jgi:hypothetical protein
MTDPKSLASSDEAGESLESRCLLTLPINEAAVPVALLRAEFTMRSRPRA